MQEDTNSVANRYCLGEPPQLINQGLWLMLVAKWPFHEECIVLLQDLPRKGLLHVVPQPSP